MIPVGFISTINTLVAAANNKLGVWEILLIIACAAIVISFVVVSIVRKKKGKPSIGCDGCCEHCSGCCHKPAPKK